MTPELQAHVKRLYETTDQPVCQIALDVGVNESVIRRMGPREGWVRFVPPPRDLPPVTTLLAEVEALEKAALSLPPPSARLRASSTRYGGGEGRFGERQRDEAGWGDSCAPLQMASNADAPLPPTPNPSPPFEGRTGGGEKEASAAAQHIERFVQVVMAHLDEFEAVRRDGKLIAKHHLTTARAISILTEAFNKLQRLRAAQPGQNHDDISDRYADLPADLDEYRLELTRRIREFLRSRSAGGDGGRAAVAAVEGA